MRWTVFCEWNFWFVTIAVQTKTDWLNGRLSGMAIWEHQSSCGLLRLCWKHIYRVFKEEFQMFLNQTPSCISSIWGTLLYTLWTPFLKIISQREAIVRIGKLSLLLNPKPIRKLSSSEDINPPSFVACNISTQILTKCYWELSYWGFDSGVCSVSLNLFLGSYSFCRPQIFP